MDVELIGAARRPRLLSADLRLARGLSLIEGPDGQAQGELLRLLALRWPPSGGVMRVGGEDVRGLGPAQRSAYARRVGFAPGDAGLPEYPRVRTALRYLAALWQVGGVAKVDAEIERWRLDARQRLGTLSPGERRRFILAASLLMSPELWLLERPFDGLDLPGRTLLRQLLVASAHAEPPRHAVLAQLGEEADAAKLPVSARLWAERGRVHEVPR